MINIPKAPDKNDNQSLHEWAAEVSNFLQQIHENGTGCTGMTDAQMNKLTDVSNAGRLVFNETHKDTFKAKVVGDTLTWNKIGEAP